MIRENFDNESDIISLGSNLRFTATAVATIFLIWWEYKMTYHDACETRRKKKPHLTNLIHLQKKDLWKIPDAT